VGEGTVRGEVSDAGIEKEMVRVAALKELAAARESVANTEMTVDRLVALDVSIEEPRIALYVEKVT
jgi:hypothetical protein